MYKITYFIGKSAVESFYMPNIKLAKWKVNQLKKTSHKLGTFKITKQ